MMDSAGHAESSLIEGDTGKVGKDRETATYRIHEAAKLLNLYKSSPSLP